MNDEKQGRLKMNKPEIKGMLWPQTEQIRDFKSKAFHTFKHLVFIYTIKNGREWVGVRMSSPPGQLYGNQALPDTQKPGALPLLIRQMRSRSPKSSVQRWEISSQEPTPCPSPLGHISYDFFPFKNLPGHSQWDRLGPGGSHTSALLES